MKLYEINDYELIYLIREGNEGAERLMYKKYNAFIFKCIKEFNVFKCYYDDFYQEGLLALSQALQTFDTNIECSFYSYLQIIIKRRFVRYFKYSCKIDIPFSSYFEEFNEEAAVYNSKKESIEDDYYENGLRLLDKEFDKDVYRLMYKEGLQPSLISEYLDVDIKKVYNTIAKIKNKLQELKY